MATQHCFPKERMKGISHRAGSSGFVVASRESEWSAALKTRDCKQLLSLLQKKPRLWRKTDPNCRTVLHVAAMQGCSQLANDVLRCVEGNNPPNIQSSQEMLLSAKEKSLCDADAFSLAKIVGNSDIMTMINTVKCGTELPPIPSREVSENETAVSEIIEVLMDGDTHARAAISLKEKFEHDVDYNFVESQKHLLYLHVACKHPEFWNFLHAVIERTKRESHALLEALFKLKDAQGRTLLHVAVEEDGLGDKGHDNYMAYVVKKALAIFDADPVCEDTVFKACVNSQDLAGRTPLHRAVANQRAGSALTKALVGHRMTDVNAIWRDDGELVTGNVTALHLAVWHNNIDAAKILLEKDETDGEIECSSFIEASGILRSPDDTRDSDSGDSDLRWHAFQYKLSARNWTALELATIMGRVHMVRSLLKARSTLDLRRCLHLAAARGDPQCLQHLIRAALRVAKGDYLSRIYSGLAPLHFAVNASHPKLEQDKISHFFNFDHFVNFYGLEKTGVQTRNAESLASPGYGGKKGCVNLLLQAGAEIWQLDDEQQLANPGIHGTDEARQWWYDKLAEKTSVAKKKFNAGGTATAVVAALIASASFSGHLSPPISYDASALGPVPITEGWVKAFIWTNNLSFYLAITSIMFALMPSIPLFHEGSNLEIIRAKRSLATAISFLLVAIFCFILSFASSAIAIMPKENTFEDVGPTAVPTAIGGFCCIIGISFLFWRLWRFAFPKKRTFLDGDPKYS